MLRERATREKAISDCERAADWWQEVMSFTLVHRTSGETWETRSLVHPTGVTVTVMTHDRTLETGAFDERRVGLDHLAFRVADRDELQRWVIHLDANGVTHPDEIQLAHRAASAVSNRSRLNPS
jgi:glyoxylase I family protein